jgi:hypothetical protein
MLLYQNNDENIPLFPRIVRVMHILYRQRHPSCDTETMRCTLLYNYFVGEINSDLYGSQLICNCGFNAHVKLRLYERYVAD